MPKQKFYSKYTNEEIEKQLDQAVWQVYDKKSQLYRYFRTEAEMKAANKLLDDGERLTSELLAAELYHLTAPAPYTLSINNLVDGVYLQKGTTGVYLKFGWTTVNGSGVPMPERVDVIVTFTNQGSTKQWNGTYAIGQSAEILIDEYIEVGQNDITIVVSGQVSGVSAIQTITYNIVDLGLISTFNIAEAITPSAGGNVTFDVAYKTWAPFAKTVEFYVDDVTTCMDSVPLAANIDMNSDVALSRRYKISKTLTSGVHRLQIRTVVDYGGSRPFYSDTLFYEFIVTGDGQIHIAVSTSFSNGKLLAMTENLSFTMTQYDRFSLPWGFYTADTQKTKSVLWQLVDMDGNITPITNRSATVVDATNNIAPDPFVFTPDTYGEFLLQAVVEGSVVKSFHMDIAKNLVVQEQTEDLVMKLLAAGRTNDEASNVHNHWDDRGYVTTFAQEANFDGECAIFEGGDTATNSCKPLLNNPKMNGATFEITFKTTDVVDESAEVLRIGNGVPSIVIYGKKAVITSYDGVSLQTEFLNGEKVKLAFIVNPNGIGTMTNEPNLLLIQEEGVRGRCTNYDGENDSFTSDDIIHIGNAAGKCGIRIYGMRVYSSALGRRAEFNNWAIDSGNITTVLDRNDIYDAATGAVSLEKCIGKIDVIKIDAPLNRFFNNVADTTIYGTVQRISKNPKLDFTITNAQIKNPGQSTRGYGISQIRIYTDKNNCTTLDYNGNSLYKGLYSMFEGAIPEKKFRMNPNFVDSSCANAAAFFHMVNDTYPKAVLNDKVVLNACGLSTSRTHVMRNDAQEYAIEQYASDMVAKYGGKESDFQFPYSILNVPQPTACVVFWCDSSSGVTTYSYLSQYILMDEKKAPRSYGQRSIYDKKLEDGTLDPFDIYAGAKGERLWDNKDCYQFETLQNADELAMFKSMDSWSEPFYDDEGQLIGEHSEQVFEQEYPDTDDTDADGTTEQVRLHYKESFCDWLASCYQVDMGGARSQAKFEAEAKNHFYLPKAAEYILRLLKNGMVDNSVRNVEMRTDDGVHWYPHWWDTDIQRGKRNDGALKFAPATDFDTIDFTSPDGTIVYAFNGHGSWFLQAFKNWSWFQNTLIPVMNTSLVNAGWTRRAMLKALDDFSGNWCESFYNESQQTKYIDQYLSDKKDYLKFMMGMGKLQGHYWIAESYDYWDAFYCSGEYTTKRIYLRCGGTPNGKKMYFKAAKDFTFGWALTDDTRIQQRNIKPRADRTFEFVVNLAGTGSTLGSNDPVILYAPNAYEVIDLHEIARYFSSTLDFVDHYDEDLGTNLKVLIIGVSKTDMKNGEFNMDNTVTFAGFSGGNDGVGAMSRLEELNIQGLRAMGSQAVGFLGSLVSLKRFYAAGSNLGKFNPARDSHLTEVELPDTITSISVNNVTVDSLKWFDEDIEETTVPVTMHDLYIYNAGSCEVWRDLVLAWGVKVSQLENTTVYNAVITNVDWEDVPYADFIKLGSLGSSRLNLTGTVIIEDEFNTDMMNTLMGLFGNDIFTGTGRLTIGSKVSKSVISATGSNVTIASDGAVEVLQGTSAKFSSVIFPISKDSNITFQWYIVMANGDKVTGTPSAPEISFGNNSLHYTTGVLTTIECTAPDLDYTIFVRASNGATGQITLRVKARSYPTEVSIDFNREGSTADAALVDNMYQILTLGKYFFDANHKRIVNNVQVPYNGNMRAASGGEWELVNGDDNYVSRSTVDFLNGRTSFDEYCLVVSDMPNAEYNLTLKYKSNWKNGLTITASPVDICLVTIIYGIVSNDALFGNPPLFAVLDKSGLSHEDLYSFNSFELKAATGALNFAQLLQSAGYEASSLKSMTSGVYNVFNYIRNITEFNFNNCTGLSGAIDVKKCTVLEKLLLSKTDTGDISITAGQSLNKLTLAHPENLLLKNHGGLSLQNAAIDDGYVVDTFIPYDADGSDTYDGYTCGSETHYGSGLKNGVVSDGVSIDNVRNLESVEITMPQVQSLTITGGVAAFVAAIEDALENGELGIVTSIDKSNINIVGEYGYTVEDESTLQPIYSVSEEATMSLATFSTPFKNTKTLSVDSISGTGIVGRMLTPTEVRTFLNGNDTAKATVVQQMGFDDAAQALEAIGTSISSGRNMLVRVVSGVEISRIKIDDAAVIAPYCSDLDTRESDDTFMDAVGILKINSSKDLRICTFVGIRKCGGKIDTD